jgi:hypothetical protein
VVDKGIKDVANVGVVELARHSRVEVTASAVEESTAGAGFVEEYMGLEAAGVCPGVGLVDGAEDEDPDGGGVAPLATAKTSSLFSSIVRSVCPVKIDTSQT